MPPPPLPPHHHQHQAPSQPAVLEDDLPNYVLVRDEHGVTQINDLSAADMARIRSLCLIELTALFDVLDIQFNKRKPLKPRGLPKPGESPSRLGEKKKRKFVDVRYGMMKPGNNMQRQSSVQHVCVNYRNGSIHFVFLPLPPPVCLSVSLFLFLFLFLSFFLSFFFLTFSLSLCLSVSLCFFLFLFLSFFLSPPLSKI